MMPASNPTRARTVLFVPGDRPERFAKAAASGADLLVIDLEDAVAPDAKDRAREHAIDWLRTHPGPTAVRINAAGTDWHDADLGCLGPGTNRLGISDGDVIWMVPKAEPSAAMVALADGSRTIVALIESAAGVRGAAEVAELPGVVRLALGTFDLAAELGVDPDYAPAMAHARGEVVLASAVAGLAGPIDGVTGDVRDTARLVADIEQAQRIGFAGKLCIHPDQVAPANDAFAPSAAEVDWARRVLGATSDAGLGGVVLLDGRMVDAPVVKRAERILASIGRPDPDVPSSHSTTTGGTR